MLRDARQSVSNRSLEDQSSLKWLVVQSLNSCLPDDRRIATFDSIDRVTHESPRAASSANHSQCSIEHSAIQIFDMDRIVRNSLQVGYMRSLR